VGLAQVVVLLTPLGSSWYARRRHPRREIPGPHHHRRFPLRRMRCQSDQPIARPILFPVEQGFQHEAQHSL